MKEAIEEVEQLVLDKWKAVAAFQRQWYEEAKMLHAVLKDTSGPSAKSDFSLVGAVLINLRKEVFIYRLNSSLDIFLRV